MSDALVALSDKVAEWALYHPQVVGVVVLVFLGSTAIVNAIKWTWPEYATMPKAARFALGLFMPLALNFWTLARKVGAQEPEPPKG